MAVFLLMEENKITRLTVGKKNQKRVNVYLDGVYAFSLYRETAAWLEVGQILSDEKIRDLLQTDQKNEIRLKAADFISYKPRTVQETRKRLEKEGYDGQMIDDVIAELLENGLLNDALFAEQWVEERKSLKPKSKRALIYELRRKGISDQLIQSAVEETDDLCTALEIAQKRIYRYEGLSRQEFRVKLGNYLAGKGFSYDVISETTRKLWEILHSSASDK